MRRRTSHEWRFVLSSMKPFNISKVVPISDGVDLEGKYFPSDSSIDQKEETLKPSLFLQYVNKFKGVEGKSPPKMEPITEILWTSLLSFTGILLVAITDFYFLIPNYTIHDMGIKMLTAAYAATAAIIYQAYQIPVAQPRNVIGGYVVSSFIGVSTRLACDALAIPRYVAGPLAVALALFCMNVTKTFHPPGGPCSLIAVIGGPLIEGLGFAYILTSAGAAFIMLTVALLGNNIMPTRQYPMYWN